MRIILQRSPDSAILIDIGYNTKLHSSMYWLSIDRAYYEYNEKDYSRRLVHANSLFTCFKHYKYWNK